MSSEKESLPSLPLTWADYDIAGNVFRAYYDNAQNMVFVVDSTQNSRKPNVLLVVPPRGDRKWDEILVTDFNVDLETVRPRKDNKYQKLDIEYGNLDTYSRIVRDSQSGADLQTALTDLNAFRDNAVRRNALARLDAAQEMAARARETIEKTNETISELNVRIKELRTKLSAQKKSIGKEPTKQSAAKILRSDSQIDATGEKISRARRRLTNAQRRLVTATDDIVAAQKILDLLGADSNSDAASHSVMVAPRMDITTTSNTTASDVPQFKEIITEPKAEKMAEEEVKPLFDKDPEILDEEIAFKPIDFGVSAVTPPTAESDVNVIAADTPAPAPLSFTPPQATEYTTSSQAVPQGDFAPIPDVPAVSDSPVLESMRPVEPVVQQPVTPVYENYGTQTDTAAFAAAAANAPIVSQSVPTYDNAQNMASAHNTRPSAPMPGVADAGVSSGFRPVSPIRGTSVTPVPSTQGKSKLMYYVMLVILIALSIFTLWIYQRSTSQNIPELTATANAPTDTEKTDIPQTAPSPFVGAEPEKVTTVAAPVEEVTFPTKETAEPEPVDIAPEPEPVAAEPEPVEVVPEPEPVVAEPEPVVIETEPVDVTSDTTVNTVEAQSPFLTEPVEKAPVNAIDIKTIVQKPIYNVSQQEKMFVAAPDYETDTPATTNQPVAYDDVETSDEAVCSDGALPDANGCCGGEIFTDMEDGTFACCQPVQGGECFAPMR